MATTKKMDMEHLDEMTSSELLVELVLRTQSLHGAIHRIEEEGTFLGDFGEIAHQEAHNLDALTSHLKKRLGEGFVEVMP